MIETLPVMTERMSNVNQETSRIVDPASQLLANLFLWERLRHHSSPTNL